MRATFYQKNDEKHKYVKWLNVEMLTPRSYVCPLMGLVTMGNRVNVL